MQRRLTLALLGVALAAVMLVGAGVLVLAQFGARQDAKDKVSEQLGALEKVVNPRTDDGIGPALRGIGRAFDAADVQLVFVASDGTLLVNSGEGREPLKGFRAMLSTDDVAALRASEVVWIDTQRTVTGIRQIAIDARALQGESSGRENPRSPVAALLIKQDVATVSRQTFVWFLLSASAVIAGSVIVAWWLARRFTAPIRSIERATAEIAAGDLDTRVSVTGHDELADLGHAVNRMATDLAHNQAAEQAFLLSISHDLRTPLTAINGYAEALVDRAADDTVHTGEVIVSNARRLNRLVGDLLDLARLDARQFHLDVQSTDINVVVGRAVAGHELHAREDNIRLDFVGTGEPVMRVVDPDRLAQAIGNLIDNGLKFASSNVAVQVSAEAVITVTDDGPGIDADDLPHVFERLYVTKNQPRRAEHSSGLGLAIVRELIAAMGGSVRAGSKAGSGTTMTIDLPPASGSHRH